MDYRTIRDLPAHLHLLLTEDSRRFGVNYEEVNMLHYLALMHKNGDVDWLEQNVNVNHPDYKYLEKVKLTHRAGSMHLFLMPFAVFLSQLPDFCNRYNVQNYSGVTLDIPISESVELLYKTFRSVGLPPNKLYGRLIEQMRSLGVKTPGDKPLALLMEHFCFNSLHSDLHRWYADRSIQISLPGFETDRNLSFTPLQLCEFNTYQVGRVICNLYYQMYKSWFDEGHDVITPDGRVYINRHSLLADDVTPRDLTIHPSEFYADTFIELAFEELNREDNEKYAEDSNCILQGLENFDGVRQLLRGSELIAEGKYMRHCIGGERYRKEILNGTSLFFHLDVPGREHGATVSFRRYLPGKLNGKVYFSGDFDNLDWWVMDQFYGYRDEALSEDIPANEMLYQLFQTALHPVEDDVISSILGNPEYQLQLQTKAHKPIIRRTQPVSGQYRMDGLRLHETLMNRYGFNDTIIADILQRFPADTHEFINTHITENLLSRNYHRFIFELYSVVTEAVEQTERANRFGRGHATAFGWGDIPGVPSGWVPEPLSDAARRALFASHIHQGVGSRNLPTISTVTEGASLPLHLSLRQN